MADRNGKRGRGDELMKGKGKPEKQNREGQEQWWIHVQLGTHLRSLHEEEERLSQSGRISEHRKVLKKMRTMIDLISYELRHRAELVHLIRHEGIADDEVLVREFLKYQLKKHRSGSTPTDPHAPGPSCRSPLKCATPSGSEGHSGERTISSDEVAEWDDEIMFVSAPARIQKKRG